MQWTLAAATAGLAIAGISWIGGADYPGPAPRGNFEPHRIETWTYTGPDAAERRADALHRAVFEVDLPGIATPHLEAQRLIEDATGRGVPACRFVPGDPTGTSAKFDCVFDGGEVVKVKYGRNPEIHAEAAATRLLGLLGYPADSVTIVPRLRCYGCPRLPFVAMHLRETLGIPFFSTESSSGYTDFEWVSVERRFPAHAIETDSQEGWSWWELKRSAAPRDEVDAMRLMAVFLAHWDNKDKNQRLVCLDEAAPTPDAGCSRPLAMIQDLGASFGPTKVNLARWHELPIWRDRATCTVSMSALPFKGASFPDAKISEAGRARFAARLGTITDADLHQLFKDARFGQFQVGTDDDADLRAWVAAFRHRADQVMDTRCPGSSVS